MSPERAGVHVRLAAHYSNIALVHVWKRQGLLSSRLSDTITVYIQYLSLGAPRLESIINPETIFGFEIQSHGIPHHLAVAYRNPLDCGRSCTCELPTSHTLIYLY